MNAPQTRRSPAIAVAGLQGRTSNTSDSNRTTARLPDNWRDRMPDPTTYYGGHVSKLEDQVTALFRPGHRQFPKGGLADAGLPGHARNVLLAPLEELLQCLNFVFATDDHDHPRPDQII